MKWKRLFEIFPPPRFLDMPYAGVAISDHAVRCVSLERSGSQLRIASYRSVALPPGTVSDGVIENKNELIKVLAECKKALGLRAVKVTLPEERGYLFTTHIPRVHYNEVHGAIEFKIEENVPLPAAELLFDCVVAEEEADGQLGVVVSALPITLVDAYTEVITAAGLVPIALEVESEATAQAVLPHDAHGVSLIVSCSADKVGLYIVSDRVVRFTSTLPLSADPASSADFIAQEVAKVLSYWTNLKHNVGQKTAAVSAVYITGEKYDESIPAAINTRTGLPASFANVWTNVCDISKTVPVISFTESLAFAPAVGLALPTHILL